MSTSLPSTGDLQSNLLWARRVNLGSYLGFTDTQEVPQMLQLNCIFMCLYVYTNIYACCLLQFSVSSLDLVHIQDYVCFC